MSVLCHAVAHAHKFMLAFLKYLARFSCNYIKNNFYFTCHCLLRLVNLELLVQYGSNAWRVHNDLLQRMVDHEQKKLKELRSRVQDTNWKRKTEQTKAGEELVQLETQ